MNSYSAKQFVETERKEQLMIDEDFLLKAEDGDYCLVDTPLLGNYVWDGDTDLMNGLFYDSQYSMNVFDVA